MSLPKLLVVVLALLSTLIAPAALAAGPYPPPSEGGGEVSETRVEAGGCVTFSGHGFAPNTPVTIRDNGELVATVRTDGQGRFSYRVCFGADAKLGKHTLTGTGLGAGGGMLTVSASVVVTGVSQRPDRDEGGNGDGAGGLFPRTGGLVGAGVVLGAVSLLSLGSAFVLVAGRSRRRPTTA